MAEHLFTISTRHHIPTNYQTNSLPLIRANLMQNDLQQELPIVNHQNRVRYSCNLNTWEVEAGRSVYSKFEANPGYTDPVSRHKSKNNKKISNNISLWLNTGFCFLDLPKLGHNLYVSDQKIDPAPGAPADSLECWHVMQ